MKVDTPLPQQSSDAAHAHSTQPVDGLQRAEELPTVPPAAELVQPPLRANLPKAGIVRGGEHGSFTRGCINNCTGFIKALFDFCQAT